VPCDVHTHYFFDQSRPVCSQTSQSSCLGGNTLPKPPKKKPRPPASSKQPLTTPSYAPAHSSLHNERVCVFPTHMPNSSCSRAPKKATSADIQLKHASCFPFLEKSAEATTVSRLPFDLPEQEKCLLWSPPCYLMGLQDDTGSVSSGPAVIRQDCLHLGLMWTASHALLHAQPPLHPQFPHILYPPALPLTFACVHWSDGEQSSLDALTSPEAERVVTELNMRLCKHSASRSAEEQWLDVGKGFMTGHTLTKHETYKDLPVSPFIKVSTPCASGPCYLQCMLRA